nr:MAG TPA: hypothetical protein [Caudoviricetes sp.]
MERSGQTGPPADIIDCSIEFFRADLKLCGCVHQPQS